jgi:hypothetical protein
VSSTSPILWLFERPVFVVNWLFFPIESFVGEFLTKSLFAEVKWPRRRRRGSQRHSTGFAPFPAADGVWLAVRRFVIHDPALLLLLCSSENIHPSRTNRLDGRSHCESCRNNSEMPRHNHLQGCRIAARGNDHAAMQGSHRSGFLVCRFLCQ